MVLNWPRSGEESGTSSKAAAEGAKRPQSLRQKNSAAAGTLESGEPGSPTEGASGAG